jgi:hypothetical protein
VRLAIVVPFLLVAGCQRTEQGSTSAQSQCGSVAETLATFEMGTAVKPEQRTPVVAKYREACASTNVSAAEVDCLKRARDTWAARACLPRMFPPKAEPANCATLGARMRSAVLAEAGSGEMTQDRIGKVSTTVEQACTEDGWPEPVVSCVAKTTPGDMSGFQVCTNQLPKPLQDKLAQRLLAAAQPK